MLLVVAVRTEITGISRLTSTRAIRKDESGRIPAATGAERGRNAARDGLDGADAAFFSVNNRCKSDKKSL
jgi:hypothetical protein